MIGNGVFDKSEKYAIKLEGGTSVVRFYKSRRSEKGKLSIRVQTGHIIWESSQSKDVEIISMFSIWFLNATFKKKKVMLIFL